MSDQEVLQAAVAGYDGYEVGSSGYVVSSKYGRPRQLKQSLKNGYSRPLKKGMTLQARFVITKRSLWQLVYDKIDNWLNPILKN